MFGSTTPVPGNANRPRPGATPGSWYRHPVPPISPGDVVALAQACADAGAFERALLPLLERSVGFDVAFFETKAAGRPPTVFGAAPAPLAPTAEQGARYEAELAPVKRAALARRGVAVDSEVLGLAAMRARSYYREQMAPVGGRHSLLAYASLRGREVAGFILGRTGGRFANRDVAGLEELLPSIALAAASFAGPVTPRGIAVDLSPRERDVLDYLCLGYTNAEIARACGTSPNTVRNQLAIVFRKIGATTRAEAVGLAASHLERARSR